MRCSPDAYGRMMSRTPAKTSFGRLYRSDDLFRSSLDFAVIGLVVYWFVAPLPMPAFDWLRPSGANTPGSPAPSNPPSAGTAPFNTSDILQAATPPRPLKLESKVRRQWFKLSDPAIVPNLHRVADQIDDGRAPAARAILDE